MQYGHIELANNLPDFPQETTTHQNSATNAAAPGSSQQTTSSGLPSEITETQMEEDQENLPVAIKPNDEPMTEDNFTLSDGATPDRDEPETGISQMDADIDSELNNLLTIDDSMQYPPLVAEPSTNQESAITSSVFDSQQSQNNE